MSALRTARAWAFAAVILSLSAFAAADRDPVLLIVAVPAACLAWFVTAGSPPRAMPRYVINLLLFIVVSWGSLTLFRGGLNVSLFSQFVAALMVIKLLDRRTCRDAAQILTLSVFLVVGAVLTSNSIWLGLMLLVYLPVVIGAVLWHQLARVEENAGTPTGTETSLRRLTKRRTAFVSIAAVGMAVPVFLLTPREIGSNAFGAWGSAAVGRVVGFNDEVKLGTGGLISESQEPVLDLEVFNRAGEPAGSTGRRFYLRGAVLDDYDPETGVWGRRGDPRNTYQPGPSPITRTSMTAVGGDRPNDWSIRQEITIRNIAGERGHLFSIWRTNQVRVDPPAQLRFSRSDGALRVQGHEGKVSYTVHSNDQEPPPDDWEEHGPTHGALVDLELPEPIRALAERLLRDAGIEPERGLRSAADDNQAVSILRNHFTAGGFRYTLDTLSAPPGRDPIEWFLTENREGHCEYFASALAAMCRTVGINARVVTGYVATDYNTTTSSYLVRASNAHAWVEAEVLPGYWRVFDPTPTADLTRIHEPPRGLLAGVRRIMDTIEFAWIRTVVSYDAETRSELLGRSDADVTLFPLLDRIIGVADDSRHSPSFVLLEAGRNALVTFCVVLLVGVVVLREGRRFRGWIAQFLRRIASVFLPGWRIPSPTPAQTLHGDLLSLYRRAGAEKPDWLPLRTFTESLGRRGELTGSARQSATRLTGLLYAVFFKEHAPGDDEITAARRDLAEIRAWAESRSRAPKPKNPAKADQPAAD